MPGGARPGAGRKLGVPNKASREIKEIARGYGPEVIEGFYRLFKEAESETARILAGRELLDRGYGKPVQSHDGDGQGGSINHKVVVEFIRAAAHQAIEHRDD